MNCREKDLFTLWKLPQRRPNWRPTTQISSELTSGSTADDWARLVSSQSSQIKPVPSLKYCPEFAQRTEALARLKTFGNDKYIALSSKIRLICTLFVSVMLYSCETWTLTADIKKKGSQRHTERQTKHPSCHGNYLWIWNIRLIKAPFYLPSKGVVGCICGFSSCRYTRWWGIS